MEKEITPNRPDLIFSYWIVLWFFLYITKIIPYNPKYLFIAGIILAVFQVTIMLTYQKSFTYIFAFVLANLLIKGIPLYMLYRRKTHTIDLYVMLFSVFVYCCWLKMNNKNIKRFFMEYLTPNENGRKSFPITNVIYETLKKV
jgi:hypothetical protein